MQVVKFEPDVHYIDWQGATPQGICTRCFRAEKQVIRGELLKRSQGPATFGQCFYQCPECKSKWSEFPGDRKPFHGKASNDAT